MIELHVIQVVLIVALRDRNSVFIRQLRILIHILLMNCIQKRMVKRNQISFLVGQIGEYGGVVW